MAKFPGSRTENAICPRDHDDQREKQTSTVDGSSACEDAALCQRSPGKVNDWSAQTNAAHDFDIASKQRAGVGAKIVQWGFD